MRVTIAKLVASAILQKVHATKDSEMVLIVSKSYYDAAIRQGRKARKELEELSETNPELHAHIVRIVEGRRGGDTKFDEKVEIVERLNDAC